MTGSTSSDSSLTSDEGLNTSETSYATEDEIDSFPSPAKLTIIPQSNHPSIQPVKLEIKKSSKIESASTLPLISVMNARSLYQKRNNFKTLVNELGLELAIVSETWEREELSGGITTNGQS